MFSRARRPANDPGFVWNVPAEMRFVRVTDDAALNIVPPGMYGVVELIAVGTTGARAAENQGWMKAFHAMETIFRQLGGEHNHGHNDHHLQSSGRSTTPETPPPRRFLSDLLHAFPVLLPLDGI